MRPKLAQPLPDWSGFFVGWIDPGEWLRYETLAGGRSYRLRVRYARGVAGAVHEAAFSPPA